VEVKQVIKLLDENTVGVPVFVKNAKPSFLQAHNFVIGWTSSKTHGILSV
jgi:hypothetical protein